MNINDLTKVVSGLNIQIQELKEENLRLQKENVLLRERLNKYEHPKIVIVQYLHLKTKIALNLIKV